MIINFGRAPLMGNDTHPRSATLPQLNRQQIDALDAIEAIARATELQIQTQPGDLHFINNLAILHRREGFVDGPAASEKRHLVRSRLRNSQHGWKIPEPLQGEWERAFGEVGENLWHIEPMSPFWFPLRKYPN